MQHIRDLIFQSTDGLIVLELGSVVLVDSCREVAVEFVVVTLDDLELVREAGHVVAGLASQGIQHRNYLAVLHL